MTKLLPVMRPKGPELKSLVPYLKDMDAARTYSNHGPLERRLSARIAEHVGVEPENVALFANGTLALEAALSTIGSAGDAWALPDFTFPATGLALLHSRRLGTLCDVDEETWAIQQDQVPTDGTFVGVIYVAPFGATPNWAELRKISCPKLVDAAASFDAVTSVGGHLDGQTILMLSLHATKALSSGEGGALVGPCEWIQDAKSWSNFGFKGQRRSDLEGLNAKMSEYHAAVGMASLDEWSSRRELLIELRGNMTSLLNFDGLTFEPSLEKPFATTTFNVRFTHIPAQVVSSFLKKDGIETRCWWAYPLSEQTAFTDFKVPRPTAGSKTLACSVIGLPLSLDLSAGDLLHVRDAIERLLAQERNGALE